MSIKLQRIFAWSGPALMVLFLIGFQIAHFVPPPSPSRGALSVARFFQEHASGIRIGMFIAGGAAALVATWSVAISLQIKRISPKHSGYAYAELVLGALLLVEFVIPVGLWEGIAFRPLAGPEITLRLNDVACLMLVGVVSTAVLEGILIGVAMLDDPRSEPIFPRWLGWFNIVAGISFIPGGLCVFVRGGIFAWDGVYSWWIGLTAFGAWFFVLTWGVLRAIAGEEREQAASVERARYLTPA
jgi:hypothetical protein